MASNRIFPGLKGQLGTIVCEHNAARHVPYFSTPSMISLMEGAATQAIHHLMEPGRTSVGYEVNVRHLAPASLGAKIVAYAELTDVERNRLTFEVQAYDGDKKIGEGTHRRAIIGANPNTQ